MNIVIRLEEKKDYKEVEYLTREAFWDVYRPGCNEHLVLHKLRKTPAFIEDLTFVACKEDKIVGNIVYSKAKIINEDNKEFELLCMGPISVMPAYKGQGIGSMLMRHSIEKAKACGYNGIVIWGNPSYYHRFGFVSASQYGIRPAYEEGNDAFMALELQENGLSGITGRFYEDPAFMVGEEELEQFEKEFPWKEKHVTDTQLK